MTIHLVLAQKPTESRLSSITKYGTGGINVDGCRIPISEEDLAMIVKKNGNGVKPGETFFAKAGDYRNNTPSTGRFPSNVLLSDDMSSIMDNQSGKIFPSGGASNVFKRF